MIHSLQKLAQNGLSTLSNIPSSQGMVLVAMSARPGIPPGKLTRLIKGTKNRRIEGRGGSFAYVKKLRTSGNKANLWQRFTCPA